VNIKVVDNVTGRIINNGGKAAIEREFIINVTSKTGDMLNITICYSNHSVGSTPFWNCPASRNNALSHNITIGPFYEKTEVGYYVNVTRSDGSVAEIVPPDAPYGYLYFTVWDHPICNFLVSDIFTSLFGTTELVAIEVRNIQRESDTAGLRLTSGTIELAKFLENGLTNIDVPLNPMEEKTIYIRVLPTTEEFSLAIECNSTADNKLVDNDELAVIIRMPANFSGLSDFGILILLILSVLIYLKFVIRNE
jgi:hypothetical protein